MGGWTANLSAAITMVKGFSGKPHIPHIIFVMELISWRFSRKRGQTHPGLLSWRRASQAERLQWGGYRYPFDWECSKCGVTKAFPTRVQKRILVPQRGRKEKKSEYRTSDDRESSGESGRNGSRVWNVIALPGDPTQSGGPISGVQSSTYRSCPPHVLCFPR